ncbi:MAG TPA: CARDB domain-containing protein, partial [Phycisphaerae bacterium]|nr:CARDB domain-containing protein [Phycisphaerae bacterium]
PGAGLPPQGYVYTEVAGGDLSPTGSKVLSNVPEYFWYRGCGPTAAAMVLGYWDMLAYPNYFVGDADTQTANVNTGIASAGHDADWVPTPDAPAPHHADNSIADFMKTSRDPLPYGWSYFDDVDNAFIGYSDMGNYSAAHSWNETYGALTFTDLQNEINAGRPMVFLVDSDGNGGTDHFVPIIGYRTSPTNQYACYTTWSSDPGIHWFDWRGISAGDDWGIHGGTYFSPAYNAIDLAPTYANASPDTLVWGDSLTYNYSVKNYGTQASGGFYVKFYLSSNNYISAGTDYYLDYVWISGGTAAGQTVSGSTTLTLPPETSLPPGFTVEDDVWIGMIVDPDNTITEGSGMEGNNSNLGEWVSQDEVAIDGKPDLVGTNFELDRNMLNLGPVTADFSVRNIGQGAFSISMDFSVALPTTINPATDPDFAWLVPSQFGDQTGLHPVPDGDPLIMEIRPESAGTVALTGTSGDFADIVLGLYDSAGNRVAYDVAMGSTAAVFNYDIPGTGVYSIYMDSFSGQGAGNYALTINAPSFPSTPSLTIDPNTGAGGTVVTISPKSDQDFYTIVAPVNAKALTVTMAGDGVLKPYVRLYSQAGTMLAANSAYTGPAEFTYAGVISGATYLIGAGGSWYTSGEADLDVQFDLYDVPLTYSTIDYYGPTNLDGDIDGSALYLDSALDRDGWTFTAEDGGLTTFTVTADPAVNPLLALYNGSGALVAVGNDNAGSQETLTCVTYMGDANCDGQVGIADLSALADHYGEDVRVTWADGDFNRDGQVGIADLVALAENYGKGSGKVAGGEGGATPAQDTPVYYQAEAVALPADLTAAPVAIQPAPALPTLLPRPSGQAEVIAVDSLATSSAWLPAQAGDLDLDVDLLAAAALAVL